jgi:hypothetical protein
MAGDWQRLASWLTGLYLVLSQGRTMPMTFPHPIFNHINQDSCHRQRSGNPLNRNRFQFTCSEQFCPLPFLIASGAYEKGTVLPTSSPVAFDPISALRVINWPMFASVNS